MELVQVGNNTYYIKNPTNIGIYKINDKDIYIIDSGNDKEAGKKILKIIDEQGWSVLGIINTHSNADHIGGNKVIQDRTNTNIYAYGIEKSITENPILESSFLYGGYPHKELRNKFLLAKETSVKEIDNNLPEGLEYFNLKGHFFDMIGIKTDDDIYFLADSLFSEETIKLNRNKIKEVTENIYNLCKETTWEDILKGIFDKYKLMMNTNQYVLIGSTIRSYLSYLYDEGRITYIFKNNKMYWKQV